MSTLYLIRHGQASARADDYDDLSDLGVEQSRVLGEAWAARGVAIDALYVGPQKRHAQTAEHMRAGAEAGGMTLPDAVVLEGSGEIDIKHLFTEAFARVSKMFPDDLDNPTARKHVRGIIGKMLQRWANGEVLADDIETHADFSTRINTSLVNLMREQGRGKTVALVSSGGPISQMARLAMRLNPEQAVQILLSLNNASVSELRYTEDQLTLIALNNTWFLTPTMHTRI